MDSQHSKSLLVWRLAFVLYVALWVGLILIPALTRHF
jgi:hypothetical protein